MDYPVTLTFKILALAPQIFVRDAQGREILYVRQKLLKLKENVRVFSDSSQSRQVYEINADRILDWSARYTFTDAEGREIGSVQRRGARSLWKASYEISSGGRPVFELEEENPWIKVLDNLLGEIPILGALTGYFLNPKYKVEEIGTNRPMFQVSKHRSLLESRFEITRTGAPASPDSETAALLGVLMMTLLERDRG